MFKEASLTGIPDLQRHVTDLSRDRKIEGTAKFMSGAFEFLCQLLSFLLDSGKNVNNTFINFLKMYH